MSLEGFDAAADAVNDAALRLPWSTLGDLVEAATARTRESVDVALRDSVRAAVEAALAGDRAPGVTRARSGATAALADGWRPGQFAFLGVDFIFDDSGDASLIEFSKAPGIRETPLFLRRQNETLIPNVLDLVLAARRHWLEMGPTDFGARRDDGGDPGVALKAALEPRRGGWVAL